MKRIVSFCFAVSMIPLYEFSEPDCMDPQLLLETSCDDVNTTSLTMYSFINNTEIVYSDGCDIALDTFHINDTFYIQCDTERINCIDKEVTKQTYYLECEEFETVIHAVKHTVDKKVPDSPTVAMILGCSVGALGSTVLLAYGAYKFKTAMQSGSYLIPEFPDTP